jgi:hypothetical protein
MNMNSEQYVGWKTMTLKYEKITFMYPSNWKLVDNSISSPQNLGGCTYPGHDYIILTSPNNNHVNLQTGIDCIGDVIAKSFGSIPVKSLGENLFLDFEADSFEVNPTGPSFACLAPSTTADSWLSFNSKNIFPSEGNPSAPMNSFCFTPFTGSDFQSAPNLTVEQIESNVDFNDAKLIFESMTY